VHYLARQGSILPTASPLGEEEPGLEDAERGGYLPIPRRDARAGERGTRDASAEPDLATAARATRGSESLSVTGTGNSDEQSLETVCEEREGAAGGEEETTKPGASVDQDQEEMCRGSVRVKRSGGAPDDQEERTETKRSEHSAPVIRNQSTPGRRPRGGGRSPSFSVTKQKEERT